MITGLCSPALAFTREGRNTVGSKFLASTAHRDRRRSRQLVASHLRRDNGMMATMVLAAGAFALMVTIGTSRTYKRGEFPSYSRCVEAARGEVANGGDDVQWDCVPVRHGNENGPE
jgi:hypothetical protein